MVDILVSSLSHSLWVGDSRNVWYSKCIRLHDNLDIPDLPGLYDRIKSQCVGVSYHPVSYHWVITNLSNCGEATQTAS